MHVTAVEDARSACWHARDRAEGQDLAALGVWTEKRHARGEDAEPLFVHNRRSGSGIMAVFDGAGGAGSAIEGASVSAVDRTGAWVGSRVARAATEEWFVHTGHRGGGPAPGGLRDALADRLGAMHTKRRRKIGGTMRRELPTTLASLAYRVEPGRLWWQAMWAGDSRCYALTPFEGLQQLSRDDTEATDALELLNSDPPMTNLLAADGRFVLNEHGGELPLPCLLLVSTDGFFGYLHTPADFEYVLLDTLLRSVSAEDWANRLIAAVGKYTGDDASLALLAVGYPDHRALRAAFTPRHGKVEHEHWRPMQAALRNGRDATVAAREHSWARYRPGYESRMPRGTGRGGDT